MALTVGQIIQLEDLQIHNHHQAQQETSGQAGSASFDALAEPQLHMSLSAGAAAVADFIPGQTQIQDYLDEIERRIIEQALQQTRYNRTQAAKLLGISFRSMRYRMERLDIN